MVSITRLLVRCLSVTIRRMRPPDIALEARRLCHGQATVALTRQLGLLAGRAAVIDISVSEHLTGHLDFGQLSIRRQSVIDFRKLGRRQARHGVRDLRGFSVSAKFTLSNRLARRELIVVGRIPNLVAATVVEPRGRGCGRRVQSKDTGRICHTGLQIARCSQPPDNLCLVPSIAVGTRICDGHHSLLVTTEVFAIGHLTLIR